MYQQVEKTKENKSRAVANSVAQKKGDGRQGLGIVDNRSEVVAQRKLQDSHVIQLNAAWIEFQKKVASGEIRLEISEKHKKGSTKVRRMERKNGKRAATGPFSNQSQERVLNNAIAAVANNTARFVSASTTDFTIEVDSEHGTHGARQFNIHKGGGGENTRYIHQIKGDTSGFLTPTNAEYSDSDSDSDSDSNSAPEELVSSGSEQKIID